MSVPGINLFLNPRLWLLASFLLLPFMLTNDSLWLDEGDTAMYATQPDFHSWSHYLRLDNEADCQMPLSMLFAWLAGQILGTGEWQMRAVNLIWGAIALGGMFRASRRLQLPWLPLILVIQPYFWFYMNEARPYALQVACGTWLLAAFVEFYFNEAAGESWAWLLVVSAFFLFLSTILAPVSVTAVILVGAITALLNHWKPCRKAMLILLGGAMANIPTALYYWSTLLRGAKGSQLWHVDLKFFGYVLYEFTGMTGLGLPTEEIRELARSPHLLAALSAHSLQFALPALGFALVLAVMIFGLRRQSPGILHGVQTGLALVLGLAALTFIAGSLVLQKAFWARHFAPVFPSYVVLLGLAMAGMFGYRNRIIKWLPFLLAGLLTFSDLNLRFSRVWRKEDYRSAAQYARQSLAENKSVWWVAGGFCATYYRVELAIFHPKTGQAFCPQVELGKLEVLQQPDVIIYSKPDIHDPGLVIKKIIEQDNYQEAARFKSFTIWTNSSHAQRNPGETDN